MNQAAKSTDETQPGMDAQNGDGVQTGAETQDSEGTQTGAETQGGESMQTSENMQPESESQQSQSEIQGQEDTASQNRAAEATSPDVRRMQAEYTVKAGDTLATVCRMYYGNLDMLDKICILNNIEDPDRILPGQKIVLP